METNPNTPAAQAPSPVLAVQVADAASKFRETVMQRERLPNRRPHIAFNFICDGSSYHCTATRLADGRVREIFLTTRKVGNTAQQHAECGAILCSLALQFGVPAELIAKSVGGPIAAALELALRP